LALWPVCIMSPSIVRRTFVCVIVAVQTRQCLSGAAHTQHPEPLQVAVAEDGSLSSLASTSGVQGHTHEEAHKHIRAAKHVADLHEHIEGELEEVTPPATPHEGAAAHSLEDEFQEEIEGLSHMRMVDSDEAQWGRRRRSRRRAIPCQWDTWGGWSKCTKACGGGTYYRTRGQKVKAANGGAACVGDVKETKACNTHHCPVDCAWKAWNAWQKCSKSCGKGEQKRNRAKLREAAHGGKKCTGSAEEKRSCNEKPCPVDCVYDEWQDWGECTKTCGNGTKTHKREVKTEAAHGGKKCDGDAEASEECELEECKSTAFREALGLPMLVSVSAWLSVVLSQ